MENHDESRVIESRMLMALIGAFAGFSMWFLLDPLPDMIDNSRIVMALAALAGAFFVVLLAVLGPLRLVKAVQVAGLVAIISAGLFTWASFRYADIDNYLSTGFALATFSLLVWLPTPFALAALTPGEGWRNYQALFSHAWQIFVRYLVAWVFAGLFWSIIFLSDQVLRIVGLHIIEDLLDIDAVPFILTGLSLGLGMAVVYELRAYVSPYLAVRLLRLLLPLVLVVSVIFLIAAPIQGLSNLFGGLSAAGVLMAMAVIAATLITSTLDGCNEDAATSRVLLNAARLMALVLPILGALAVWAVWQRIAQYGLTPTRLAAVVSMLLVLAYGLTYAVAVLRGGGWQDRIRQANITMALVLIALSALWLSPALNAERMSANSQMARFESGKTTLDDLDLWALDREWGRTGQAAMVRLRELEHPERAALDTRIARLAQSDNKWEWQRVKPDTHIEQTKEDLIAILALSPEGVSLPPNAFEGDRRVHKWLEGCQRTTPAGNPGCVAIVADFDPVSGGDEVLVVFLDEETYVDVSIWNASLQAGFFEAKGEKWLAPDVIDKILAGSFNISPSAQGTLLIGEFQIVLEN